MKIYHVQVRTIKKRNREMKKFAEAHPRISYRVETGQEQLATVETHQPQV
jgi:hypothetical protein